MSDGVDGALLEAIVEAVVVDDDGEPAFVDGAAEALTEQILTMARAGDGAEAMDSVLDAIGVLTAQGAPRAADAVIDVLFTCGGDLLAALDEHESEAGVEAQRRFASFISERGAEKDPRLDDKQALPAHLLGGKRRI